MSECGEVVREEWWSGDGRFFVDLEVFDVEAGVVKVDGMGAAGDAAGEMLAPLEVASSVLISMKPE